MWAKCLMMLAIWHVLLNGAQGGGFYNLIASSGKKKERKGRVILITKQLSITGEKKADPLWGMKLNFPGSSK